MISLNSKVKVSAVSVILLALLIVPAPQLPPHRLAETRAVSGQAWLGDGLSRGCNWAANGLLRFARYAGRISGKPGVDSARALAPDFDLANDSGHLGGIYPLNEGRPPTRLDQCSCPHRFMSLWSRSGARFFPPAMESGVDGCSDDHRSSVVGLAGQQFNWIEQSDSGAPAANNHSWS